LVGPWGLDIGYMLVTVYGLEMACKLVTAPVTACWWLKARAMARCWAGDSALACKLVPPSGLDMGYKLARAYALETACKLASAPVMAGWRLKVRVKAWQQGRDPLMV